MNNDGDLCLTCGLPTSQCICGKSKPDRTINIVHKFKKETGDELDEQYKQQLAKLKKERDDSQNMLALTAEAEYQKEVQKFEAEKEDFLDLCKDEDKRQELVQRFDFDENNPDSFERAKERLSDAKLWSSWIQQAVEGSGGHVTGGSVNRRPSGKASIRRNDNNSVDSNFKTYVDELYAIKRNPAKTEDEKMEADRMLDEMFLEVIKGVNVSRRARGRGLPSMQVNQCPQCQRLIQSPRGHVFDECPECGWTLYSKDARRG